MSPPRPLPRPTPETQHFWDGTASGELRLQRCRACSHTYFPPQPFCPACASDEVEIVRASGRGSLYSYVITHRAAPGFEAPYVIAEVELEEGPRLLSNLVGVAPDPEQLPLDRPLEVTFEAFGEVTLPFFPAALGMSDARVAIVGAAETEEIGTVALSALGLATDAARRALADCGLRPADVDGVASSGLSPYLPTFVAHSLGVDARWVDATMVGGCSNLVHLRHAVAAIEAGQCEVVLIVHGESGRSGLGGPLVLPGPGAWQGQFELPYGTVGPMTLLTLGALRFLRDRGLERDALANVVVAQRDWAARNPRALRRDPITVDEVLDAPVVAYPFTRPMCCVTTDAGGAIVVTSAERAPDLPRPAVHVLGSGEATGAAMASQMPDLTSSDAFRHAGAAAFADAGVAPSEIQHAMLYDATAHLPLMALEDVGLVPRRESGAFVADGNTAIGGSLPVNTSGGGLNYTHSGMYGMYALQESIRQLRGEAAAQVDGVTTSLTHAIGGMFQSAATVILATEQR